MSALRTTIPAGHRPVVTASGHIPYQLPGSADPTYCRARLTASLPRLARLMAPLKGILMTRLEEPAVWVVNTHLLANFDGDWSSNNRYYALHRHQLATLARVLGSLAGPLIVSGDFNVARDSSLFEDFTAESRLADAFNGACPPTFHPEYLGPRED